MSNRRERGLGRKMLNFVLCLIAMLFVGCGILFSPTIYPITDGFQKTLPGRNARIVVWGEHPSAVGTATTWLQKRGITVLERARLKQILDEQMVRLTHTPDDEAQVLRVGKILGADLVVFVDSPFTTGISSSFGVSAYGGSGSSATVYSTSVSIRGVNGETGEVAWTGNARYPQDFGNLDDTLAKLTCQALATAWGFRPPGHHEISSQSMCQLEKQVSP